MKIISRAVCVLALFPSIAYSKSLRREKGAKTKDDFRSVHQHGRQLKASDGLFVGVAPLVDIKHAALNKGTFTVTTIDSTTIEISSVRDHEDGDGTGELTSHSFRGKLHQSPMCDYTASCFTRVKADITSCNIYQGSPPDITPNGLPTTTGAAIQKFCSPDPVSCDYYPNTPCLGDYTVDISNDTCANEGYTCVASTECQPQNEYACGHGYVGSDPVSCEHSIICTGSDGKANQTACTGLNMSCFDLCGPV